MTGHGPVRPRWPEVLRWAFSLAIVVILTGFALLLLSGSYANDGSIILVVADGHGVHQGDVFVLAGWATGVLSALGLAAGRR